MPLWRITYYSENQIGLRKRYQAIAALQATAVERNRTNSLSGMLLYDDQWFVQTLEGELATLEESFAKISKDPRHSNIVIVSKKPVLVRLFGEWSMGFATPTSETMPLFGKHWYNKGLNPGSMSEDDILDLMEALVATGAVAKAA